MRYKAVFLDFYGTAVEEDDAIIDRIARLIAAESPRQCTPEDVLASWPFAEMCRQAHGESFETQRTLERKSLQVVLDRYQVARDAGELASELFAYWREPKACASTNVFLLEIGLPICIVSNSDRADLECALEYHNWAFAGVVTSEDVRAYKPRSEPFEAALALMGLRAEDVVHIGDSLTADIAGARALGIDALWINRKGRPLPQGGQGPAYEALQLGEAAACLR